MSPNLGILDLLELRGFDLNQRFKLVRHQDAHYNLQYFLRQGWFETYQKFQDRPVFKGVDCIVAFIGLPGTRACLVGVYRILDCRAGSAGELPLGCPHKEWLQTDHFYQMERVEGFEYLEGRVVIEWGKGTRRWDQWPQNKEVVEILPKGELLLPPFDDYLDVFLPYRDLKLLFSQPEAYREWRARLSAVAGVYLILATTTGAQYVGSAHGVEGILGRWASYAQNGHGGNKLLKDLIHNDHAYPDAFSYSILQILPRTSAQAVVLRWEERYKRKLGSRAIGLNIN